ncbi:MAG: TadE/TadG family type IV pilus assembly protein [Parvularculaceae bacterium]
MGRGGSGNNDGNVALAFALIAPVLFAGVGAGVEASRYYACKSALQEIADRAALSGARQYFLDAPSRSTPEAVAVAAARAGLDSFDPDFNAEVNAAATPQAAGVKVAIAATFRPALFASAFKQGVSLSVEAQAEARGAGRSTCIIGLDPTSRSTVLLNTAAQIRGPNCSVHSNSTSNAGLEVLRSAKITSAVTCTSGGYFGSAGNFSSTPLTDCPPREDPLADRPKPAVGSCNINRKQVDSFTGALDPGVYCGGLVINGNSDVTLNPGIYVIKDGPFSVLRTSKVRAKNVGFFFTGRSADLYFQDQSDISLSGPVSGLMGGVLFWQDDEDRSGKLFEVRSTKVHTLTGTIYLPNSTFYASANAPVAQSSAYTAIVARKISLDGQVELVLNDDYGATDVPVPAGIGGAGGDIMLRR